MPSALSSWRVAFVVGLGLISSGSAQQIGFAPQIDPAQVTQTAQRMAERVRILGEEAGDSFAGTPGSQYLRQDVEELSQSLDDFAARSNQNTDPNRLRQQFRGINTAWSTVRGQLLRPSVGLGPAPGVDRSVARIDELDNQLQALLGLNATPRDFYGQGPPLTGLDETRRLAHALADRALALSSTVRVEMLSGPNGNLLAREADDLARAGDAFHDALESNRIPAQDVAGQFGQTLSIGEAMRRDYAGVVLTPNVRNNWAAYQSVEALLRQRLNLGTTVVASPIPPQVLPPVTAPGPAANLVPVTDQLLGQLDDFIRVFSATAGRVPEGRQFLDDAGRMRNATINFRNELVAGADLGRLAYQFRDVDDCFQRLARRTSRIAQGRTGPNIQQVQLMGQSCSSIHQFLGMPGFPAQLPGFNFP